MPAAPVSRYRTVFRWVLGLFLFLTGVAHLTWVRSHFLAQVPPWFPMKPELVVILSGVVELVLGAALMLAKRHRVLVGWIVAAFFVAVFPGNVSQYLLRLNAFGLNTDALRLGRLFLQPVLVIWALWSTRPAAGSVIASAPKS